MNAKHDCSSSYMKQVVLVQYLLSLALLCAASQANHPLLAIDADMGIHTYDSVLNIGAQLLDIRIQLRFLCSKQQDSSSGSGSPQDTAVTSSSSNRKNEVTIEGFVSAFPVNNKPPPWTPIAPHYVPPNVRQQLNITIISRVNSASSTTLGWLGPKDQGLWRARAHISGPGPFQLQVSGADTVHDLPHPMCPQQQRPSTPDLSGGIWNVLTTTSNSTLDPQKLAFLVLEHHSYHRALGLNGTILRSNIDESRAMLRLPEVEGAVKHQGLVMWVWDHEHVASWSTHYWQRPKNQLTLLGSYGRGAKLAFFDLDEYLVIPSGATVMDAKCFGQPLLHKGDNGRMGSWAFVRYQAKTCADSNADLPCWEEGHTISSQADIELLHDLCPMSFGHGKHIMEADMVDTVSVHYSYSERFEGNRLVNTTCGYLLHFYSLLEGRRALVTGTLRKIPATRWTFNPATGRREVWWPEGLAPLSVECSGRTNLREQSLRSYKALQVKSQSNGLEGTPADRAHLSQQT